MQTSYCSIKAMVALFVDKIKLSVTKVIDISLQNALLEGSVSYTDKSTELG